MRTREEIDKIIKKGLKKLKSAAGLCAVLEYLYWHYYLTFGEKRVLYSEIKKISNVKENKNRESDYFLGRSDENKEFRSYIFLLAIEKLYSEGEL